MINSRNLKKKKYYLIKVKNSINKKFLLFKSKYIKIKNIIKKNFFI
jgi:hypothetical protein